MKIEVKQAALEWLMRDWGFKSGDFVRIFVRYGGSSTVQDSFSLGIAKDEPNSPAYTTTIEGITFYMEQDDSWYVDGKDLTIDYDAPKEEVVFLFS
ncbi:HesB/YadR/YfhF family protein [Brevibacillus fulvus]|uniref:Uncharacterized protein YneR n=1 Tax=Brevibacillus fulvus TaxID=1125967 RepID=A0A939BVD1_9BACL|nr:iron-sulfur cluster biosynthesis family protein [Brevibacillus fulvus]MBM7591349.1 uncharacterized protein YneR [Brevibacillus fulvus]